jgi:ABC-type sugar transport system ATPase subunit
VVGFRPEHLQLTSGERRDGEVRIPATVDVVEYLGDELLLHLHAGEVTLVAKVPVEQRARPEQDVTLTLPADKLHLFDRESEESLELPA